MEELCNGQMEKSSMNCDHVITDALTAVIFTSSGSSIVTEVLDTGGVLRQIVGWRSGHSGYFTSSYHSLSSLQCDGVWSEVRPAQLLHSD